jgi:hypothetical protein
VGDQAAMRLPGKGEQQQSKVCESLEIPAQEQSDVQRSFQIATKISPRHWKQCQRLTSAVGQAMLSDDPHFRFCLTIS